MFLHLGRMTVKLAFAFYFVNYRLSQRASECTARKYCKSGAFLLSFYTMVSDAVERSIGMGVAILQQS